MHESKFIRALKTHRNRRNRYLYSGNVWCNHLPFVRVLACQPQIMNHTMSDRSCRFFHPCSLGVSNLQKIEVGYHVMGVFGLASHPFGHQAGNVDYDLKYMNCKATKSGSGIPESKHWMTALRRRLDSSIACFVPKC